ncbi:MAG: endonuclease III [Phycisphaerae bacterium]
MGKKTATIKKKAGRRSTAKKRPKKKGSNARAGAIGKGVSTRPGPIDTGESLKQRRTRAGRIVRALKKAYGPVDCALNHKSALQLLIATILSAQSTDENVNRVTPGLWKKYGGPSDFADAPTEQLEADIRSTGFFRQKTKSIQGACRIILDQFGGQVPDNMDDLLKLPGVARKTANVVLGTWFGRNDGVVVDTHVGRLAQRMGLTWTGRDDKDAPKIETDLMEILPQKEWTYFSHAMIRHGRAVCSARKPECGSCILADLCPSAGAF